MRVRVAIDIEAPLERVWSDVADMASHADWMADAESISFVGDRRSGIGTVMIVPTRVGPLSTEDWIIVTEWEEMRRIGVIHAGIVTGVGAFTLSDMGDGRTRFEWDEDLTLPMTLGGRLGEIVAKPIVARIWESNLRRLADRFADEPDQPVDPPSVD